MAVMFNYEYREQDLASLRLEELAAFALAQEEVEEEAETSVTFVDDEEMARLNQEYRGKTGPTDVLSFECDGMDDEFPDGFEDEGFVLGDIIIAPDVAERQATHFGTTFAGELNLLLVHGLLHLCGYDHIEDDEAEEMKEREREILTAWGAESGDATATETLIFLEHPHHGRDDD